MLRQVPTPARSASSLPTLLQGLDIGGACKIFGQLPEHLKAEARHDLLKRLAPELQAWQEHWDTDDGGLEPEEALSDEESDADRASAKKQRLSSCFSAGPVEAVWAGDGCFYPAMVSSLNKDGTITVDWDDEWEDEASAHRVVDSGQVRRPSTPGDDYPSHFWQNLCPGKQGFNKQAQHFLFSADAWRLDSQGEVSLLPQQKVVACLAHPLSQVRRLLCDHNVGSGKTLVMIRMLDNHYFDARAKIVVFPKDTVVDNFYISLWEWPSRWRDYCCLRNPREASIAANAHAWRDVRQKRWRLNDDNAALKLEAQSRQLSLQKTLKEVFVRTMRHTLEMKGAIYKGRFRDNYIEDFWINAPGADVHPPAAPLRGYRMTSAGGRAAEIVDSEPRGAIFKFGFAADMNPYSGKVILMDEAHHLTRPSRMYQQQLKCLRQYLETSANSTLMICTGSMAENSSRDARELLNVVKGTLRDQSDEGFLSSHHKRGPSFPRQIPTSCADGAYTKDIESKLTKNVPLRSHALMRYVLKAIKIRRDRKADDTLANFTNLHVYFGSIGQPSASRDIMSVDEDCIPKFAKVLDDVVACWHSSHKCVVMVGRRTGYKAMLQLLQQLGAQNGFNVATYSELRDFNSNRNANGQLFLVILLDADGEGQCIECYDVRKHMLVDVPPNWGQYKQRCGRVVRCGSHDNLPEHDRDVRFVIYAAELPKDLLGDDDVGTFALWAFCGMWGGPKTIVPSSEPPPDDIEEAILHFRRFLIRMGINSMSSLRSVLGAQGSQFIKSLLKELDLDSKLQKRMQAALYELGENPAACSLPQGTIDERLLKNLCDQAEAMTPAMARLRCCAIDAGLY